MKYEKGELLAPVGNLEMLDAAINGGADAVFLAGPKFGARASDAAFSEENLLLAIQKAHLYGVKVFITLNTLIKQGELADAKAYVDWLVAAGANAIIVQDLALVRYIHGTYPNFPIHASTQMAITDVHGVIAARNMGISRVVVARETPLETIKEMVEIPGVAIEVFVHGALCYAYSGQCLLSSATGGRSGNRGQCAQPCRKRYKLEDLADPTYAMSMKDLSTLDNIQLIAQLGVASFKIEGRLRNPDYVFHTVRAYRRALDGAKKAEIDILSTNMYAAFNRDYTGGHLLGDTSRLNLDIATNKGEHVGFSLGGTTFKLKLKLIEAIRIGDGLKIVLGNESRGIEVFNIYVEGQKVDQAQAGQIVEIDFNGRVPKNAQVYRTRSQALTDLRLADDQKRHIQLKAQFDAQVGQPMCLTLTDGKDHVTFCSETPVEEAKSRPSTDQEVIENLVKMGGTAFSLEAGDVAVNLLGHLFIPKSAVNQLRRQATDELTRLRMQVKPDQGHVSIQKDKISDETYIFGVDEPRYHIYVQNPAQAQAVQRAFGQDDSDSYAILCERPLNNLYSGQAVLIEGPFSTKGPHMSPESYGSSKLSALSYEKAPSIWTLPSQIYNHEAAAQLADYGVNDILISPELAARECVSLMDKGLRALVYGKLPVMYTRTCPKKQAGLKCASCSKSFTVKGDAALALKVTCDGSLLTYYTELPMIKDTLFTNEHKQNTKIAISFFDEDDTQIQLVIQAIRRGQSLDIPRLSSYERPIF